MGLLTGGFSEVFRSLPNHVASLFGSKGSNATADDFIKEIEKAIKSQNTIDGNPSYLSKMDTNSFYNTSEGSGLADLIAGWTGSRLTTAEEQANAFNRSERIAAQNFEHNEAVDARMWQQYVEENKYAWNTQSMQNAGVNPALVYGGGNLVGTAATGAAGSSSPANSVSPSHGSMGDLFNMLFSLARLPKELKQLDADIERTRKEGDAVMMNAESNKQNAESNARQAGAAEKRLSIEEERNRIEEKRVQIEDALAQSDIELKEWEANEISKKCLILEKQFSQMDEYLDIAKKNASSQEKQALAALRNSLAALRQADAAVQNAATNDRMADYDSDLRMAQTFLAWAEGAGKEIVNKYLDDAEQARLDNLLKQNLVLDEQGRLIHKEGNLATARMVREYINCATDIANTVSRFTGININTSSPGGTMPSLPVGTYDVAGGYGTYYQP